VKEKLRKWDEAFVREHGRLPNNNDYMSVSEFKELSQKKKTSFKLLESRNIVQYMFSDHFYIAHISTVMSMHTTTTFNATFKSSAS